MLLGRCCLSNDVGELRKLSVWIRDRITDAGNVTSRADNVDLCVHEAVVNIVQHGYRRGAQGTIAVTVEAVDRGLAVTIADNGHPFNPLLHPAPHRPLTIDDARDGGFGIDLIRSFADELEYRRENEHNILMLRFQETDKKPAPLQTG